MDTADDDEEIRPVAAKRTKVTKTYTSGKRTIREEEHVDKQSGDEKKTRTASTSGFKITFRGKESTASKLARGATLHELLDAEVCEALSRADISSVEDFKKMTNWDEDLAREALKTDIGLKVLQVGQCLQLLRGK